MKWLVILWCRWWLLAIPVAILIPASVAAALHFPGGYVAHSLLLMQETVALSPLDPKERSSVGRIEQMSVRLQNIKAVLHSDVVLGRVVDHQSGLGGKSIEGKERAYALRALSSRVSVSLVGDSLLRFELEGGRPQGLGDELQQILGSFLEALMFPAKSNSSTIAEFAFRERLSVVQRQLSNLRKQSTSLQLSLPKAELQLNQLHGNFEALTKSAERESTEGVSSRIASEIEQIYGQINQLSQTIDRKVKADNRIVKLAAKQSRLQSQLQSVAASSAQPVESHTILRGPGRLVVMDPPKDPSIRSKSRFIWAVFGVAGSILLGVLFITIAETFHPLLSDRKRVFAIKNRAVMRVAARLLGTGKERNTAMEPDFSGFVEYLRRPAVRAGEVDDTETHPGGARPEPKSEKNLASDEMHETADKRESGVESKSNGAEEAPRRPFTHAAEIIILGFLFASMSPGSSSYAARTDEIVQLPAHRITATPPVIKGRTILVGAGDNLQRAIDSARGGDEVVLAAGAVFKGSYVLRRWGGEGWITIRSAGPLPSPSTRATPADIAGMATILAPGQNQSAITTESGAHNYYLIGLNIAAAPDNKNLTSLVNLSAKDLQTAADLPKHIVIDRSYIHGNDGLGLRRGIALNSAWTAIVNSTITGAHHKDSDAQAICGWDGPGPFLIENNHLEGSGENIMFGGADPRLRNLIPSDITIRGNDISKPESWRGKWLVKNLLELKLGYRVLIEKNRFRNNWEDGQSGFAIVLKTTHQEGRAPWSKTSHVTFRDNVVMNSPSGLKISAAQNGGIPSSHYAIENNTFINIGKPSRPPEGALFMLLGYGGSVKHVSFSNNRATRGIRNIAAAVSFDGEPTYNLSFTGNVLTLGAYGIKGSGTRSGFSTLKRYAPGVVFEGNSLVGGLSSGYGKFTKLNTFLKTAPAE